jgi:hypothetical protein
MPDFGVAEREAMKVAAMELASWNPLVNVNTSAMRMIRMAISNMGTRYICGTDKGDQTVSYALYKTGR